MKNRCENAFEKNIEQKLSKIDLGINFGLPKPPKIASKTSKIALQSDAERSLFRDAMKIARKSSEVNGTHRL